MDIIIETTNAIHIYGLTRELAAANIPNTGVSHSTGQVVLHGISIPNEQPARNVVTAHSALIWISREQNVLNRAVAAKATAKAIPNWATWTQAQFQTWVTNNLMSDAAIDATTLSAGLKINLKANNAFTRNAGQLLLAMRDQIWPDLGELE